MTTKVTAEELLAAVKRLEIELAKNGPTEKVAAA